MRSFLSEKKNFFTIAFAFFIFIAIPLTVISTLSFRDNRSKAATILTGDINADGAVNSSDLAIILTKWGSGDAASDINKDGLVGSSDLAILLSNWGKSASVSNFQPTTPYYATFFYPWYGTATDRYNQWNDLGHTPPTNWFSNYLPDINSSTFDPTSELYRSTDDATLYWQLGKLKEAKQEVAISSWWGQGHKTDTAFNKIITDVMNRPDNPYPNLRWAFYYEKEGNLINGSSDPTVVQIQSDLTYIKTNYASQPAMLKINGKPVIFVYGDNADGAGMASRWAQANVAKDFYIVLKVYPGYSTDPNQPDSWHQYSPAVRTDSQGAYSYSVSPGFWLSGDIVRSPRDLAAFRNGLTSMVASSAKWKLTKTWNEWGEGSSVEPGDEVIQTLPGSATLNPSGSPFKNQYVDALNQLLPVLETGCTTNCDTTAPTVAITSPANTASVQGPVSVVGSASDNVGVTKVEFYVDGGLKNTVTVDSYNFSWDSTTVPNGSHTLMVKAYDAAGNGPGTASVNVTVNNLDSAKPLVTITSPVGGANVSSSMTLSGTATDNVGVTKVEYYIDTANTSSGSSNTSGTSTAFIFSVNTSSLSNTSHSFKVVAYDAATNQNSASVTVLVFNDTQAPSVPTGLTANLASAGSKQVNLSWNASADNTGGSGLKSYLITRNSVVIPPVNAPTTIYSDTTTNYNTTYSYTVSATDNSGNTSGPSAAVSITTPNIPDTTAPTTPTVVSVNAVTTGQVNVSWASSTDSGTGVNGYNVFREGSKVGTTAANSLSYGDIFNFVSGQTYNYSVSAFDSANPVNTSAQSSQVSIIPNPPITTGSACGFKTTPPATYNHVVVLMFENHSYTSVIGSSSAPYINSLVSQCATSNPATSATKNGWHDANYRVDGTTDGNYVSKPSYATLTSGVPPTVHGLLDDNYSTTSSVNNIYNQLIQAGKTFKDYYSGSASTTPCSSSNFSGAYHDPMRYYTNLGGQSTSTTTICNTHDVPLSTFMTDVNAGNLPAFSFILPTNSENMHDNSVATGDTWAQNFLTPLLNSAQYKSGDTAVFFLWDEDTPIPNVLIAPSIIPGSKVPLQTGNPISHFSGLRTIEEMLGLPNIGDVSSAPSLRGILNW